MSSAALSGPVVATSRTVSVLAVALLVLMAVLAGGAALRESVTFDEVAHIGAGVSYLQKFDLRLNEEHPPLPKILAALPLVVRGTRAGGNCAGNGLASASFGQPSPFTFSISFSRYASPPTFFIGWVTVLHGFRSAAC